MNIPLSLITPSKNNLERIATDLEAARERARMDFLSDPSNSFSYSIKPDGQCKVEEPWPLIAGSLRTAIDWLLLHPDKQRRK